MVFEREEDYDSIDEMDELVIENVLNQVDIGKIEVINKTKNTKYKALLEATDRQKKMILKGGLLNLIKSIQ